MEKGIRLSNGGLSMVGVCFGAKMGDSKIFWFYKNRAFFFVNKKKIFWVKIDCLFVERVAPKGLNFIFLKKDYQK